MTRTLIALVIVGAAIAGVLVLEHTHTRPALPPMVVHCASGVGGMGVCSEWSAELTPEKTFCQKAEGIWAGGPCPSAASSAGGVCVVANASRSGALHYASGWQDRAKSHCEHQGGALYDK